MPRSDQLSWANKSGDDKSYIFFNFSVSCLAFLHAQVESTHRLNETSLDVILNTIAVLIHEKLPEIEFELTRKSVTEV
ncbi:unnamed protein product [Knipowitschia caucasica]